MSIPTVPLTVGSANLGTRPVSSLGDTTLEQNIREFYRKSSGRWNRLYADLAPGAIASGNNYSSRNLKVSNVVFFAYPDTPGASIDITIWETTSPNTANVASSYSIIDRSKHEYPGLDDRTFWTIKNNGLDSVRVAIFYQEAGQ